MRRLLTVLAAMTCVMSLGACRDRAKEAAQAEAALTTGQAYLAANAKKPGVVTLPSGLQYRVIKSGPASGVKPGRFDEIKVDYEGKLTNGHVFDSSFTRGQPMSGPLSSLIPGWVEALQLMRPGDEWELTVPAKLGYGEQDMGEIPPNSVLIFRIQLIDVLKTQEGVAQG